MGKERAAVAFTDPPYNVPMQLVTPPSPFVLPEAVVGMAVYSAKAMLHGHGNDVWDMIVENIP